MVCLEGGWNQTCSVQRLQYRGASRTALRAACIRTRTGIRRTAVLLLLAGVVRRLGTVSHTVAVNGLIRPCCMQKNFTFASKVLPGGKYV